MERKEELKEIREQFMKMLDDDVNMYPELELEPVANWMDGLVDRLRAACAEAVTKWPEDEKGTGEALMLGLARFNCMVLEKFQRGGFVTEGNDAYELFVDVLMPTAHEMVKRELDESTEGTEDTEDTENEDTAMAIARKVADPDVPIEDIVKEFFRDDITDEQRRSVTDKMREMRKEKFGVE